MKTHTIKVLSALFLSFFLVTACNKAKNTGTGTGAAPQAAAPQAAAPQAAAPQAAAPQAAAPQAAAPQAAAPATQS
jgi:hypothetical protein